MTELKLIKTELKEVSEKIQKIKTLHSPIGASSMYRWSVCPASVRLSKGVTPTTSSYAEEGTIAHDWLAKLLLGKVPISAVPQEEGMRDAVVMAFDAVRSQMARKAYQPENRLWVEHGFDLNHIYEGCHGTADVVIHRPADKLLIVADYKHGAGMLVEVENNKQGQYYALGALTTLDGMEDVETVRIQIIQPRCEHPSGKYIRSWDTTPADLLDFAADLQEACELTEDVNAALVPGDHCRFCPASPICPAIRDKANSLAKTAFKKITGTADMKEAALRAPQNPKELAKALKWLPVLESWIKNVRSYSYNQAMQGNIPPGYKLVEKRKSRRWADPVQFALFMKKHGFKDDEIYEPKKVKSPAQVEKTMNKTEKETLEDHIIKESSGLKLVSESEKGIAVEPASMAAKAFVPITDGESEDE